MGEMDGGAIENVSISNITMQDIHGAPIFLRLGNRGRGPDNPPAGKLRNFNISDRSAVRSNDSHITGIPGHPVEDVRLNNIRIMHGGVGSKEDAKAVPPEKESAYYHLSGPLPSYGLFVLHAQGVTLNDVTFGFENEDLRPALYCEDVDGLELDNFKAERAADGEPSVVLKNVKNMAKRDLDG